MGQSVTNAELFFYRLHDNTVLIDRYYTPLLCLLGAIGNSLSLLVFCLDSQYRSQSAAYYLSVLALSDTGYLLNLFAVWLESVKELVITSDFICPLVMYLGQVTCFLSIYLIVAFSIERYVAVHYPLARIQICTTSKARKIIGGLTLTALIIFSYAWIIARVVELDHPLISNDQEENIFNGNETQQWTVVYRCSVPEKYYSISEIANYLDTCITFIIPFFLITFLNGRIAWSLWKMKDIRKDMVATATARAKSTQNNSSVPTSLSSSIGSINTAHLRNSRHGNCKILTFVEGILGKKSVSRAVSAHASVTIETGGEEENIELGEMIGENQIIEEDEDATFEVVTPQVMNPDCGGGDDGFASGNPTEARIIQVCRQQGQDERQQTVTFSSSSSSEIRVTKTLLLVSFVFLILNLPLHLIRCTQFIQNLTASSESEDSPNQQEPELESSSWDLMDLFLPTIQLWANMLFNTNFAVNFLLYCANGRNFRKSLQKILSHRILRRNQTLQSSILYLTPTPHIARHHFVKRTNTNSASATQQE